MLFRSSPLLPSPQDDDDDDGLPWLLHLEGAEGQLVQVQVFINRQELDECKQLTFLFRVSEKNSPARSTRAVAACQEEAVARVRAVEVQEANPASQSLRRSWSRSSTSPPPQSLLSLLKEANASHPRAEICSQPVLDMACHLLPSQHGSQRNHSPRSSSSEGPRCS